KIAIVVQSTCGATNEKPSSPDARRRCLRGRQRAAGAAAGARRRVARATRRGVAITIDRAMTVAAEQLAHGTATASSGDRRITDWPRLWFADGVDVARRLPTAWRSPRSRYACWCLSLGLALGPPLVGDRKS